MANETESGGKQIPPLDPRACRPSGRPEREIRAQFDATTITVYQAYSQEIALPAAANGSFAGTPFRLDRMTWIKPSFLWMMYRSGWATKPGQEHILAVTITRAGFEDALSTACLSSFERSVDPDRASWEARKATTPVRVQWDPERDVRLGQLPWRSIQVGLSGSATENFVNRWTVRIDDVTLEARQLRQTAQKNPALLPNEIPYPLPPQIARVIGASGA